MTEHWEYPERPIVAVGVVVLRGDEVMLVQRGNEPNKGKWSIPGGKQKLSETVFEAVHRELEEETGVSIGELVLIDVEDIIVPDGKGKTMYHYTILGFKGQWESGECRSGDDILYVEWFKLNELASLELTKKTRDFIFKAVGTK